MSGQHPSDSTLFACASRDDAEVLAHVGTCGPCATRFARLQAGASIIDAVRRDGAPVVDWRAMDARIQAAAESAASDIRRGALRPPRRIHAPVYIGVALAAAAAGVFMLRTSVRSHDAAPDQIASTSNSESGRAPRVIAPAPVPGEAVSGTVLLVAAPVNYAVAGGEAAPMSVSTEIREGGRIAADDHGGRAVVALHAGFRVDARAGADLTVARLSTTETLLELAKGEARLDGPSVESGRTSLKAGGWTLLAKGGGFVTKVDGDVVRVRVMSGKVGVSREGVAERDANAGEDIELVADGTGFRVLSHEARDGDEIDGSLLASDGRAVTVPRLSDRMVVSIAGRGALPAGITALRVRSSISLQAQVGDESWSLTADPNATSDAVVWRRSPRVAARPASAAAPSALGAPSANAATLEVPTAAELTEPAAAPRYSVRGTAAALDTWRGYTHTVSEAVAACIDGCTARNTCPSAPSISIHVEPNANGSAAVRVSGISDAMASCIRSRVEAITVPTGYRGQEQLVTLSRQ